jgi:hypothetical protein
MRYFALFCKTTPDGLLKNHLQYFLIWLPILQDICDFQEFPYCMYATAVSRGGRRRIFRSHERKAKKNAKKKEREKSESAERVRKNAISRFFLPHTLEAQLQNPKILGRGKGS